MVVILSQSVIITAGLCITDKQNEREHIFIDCQKMPMPMGAYVA
jgi:hypothetical protein